MNEERSTEDIIRIPSIPSIVKTLAQLVHHPDDLDEATKNRHVPASLLNFYLATPLDLSLVGLGHVVHIPVQISKRKGGRKSLFYLKIEDAETLTGIYVTDRGIALSFIQRMTGSSLPAQTGDTYLVRLTNREGEEFFQGRLELKVTDASAGEATLYLITGGLQPMIFDHCIIWTNVNALEEQPS